MNVTKRFTNGKLMEYSVDGVPQSLALGDKLSRVATPIARILKLPCIDKNTGKLKPDSGCAKRRDKLNQWTTRA